MVDGTMFWEMKIIGKAGILLFHYRFGDQPVGFASALLNVTTGRFGYGAPVVVSVVLPPRWSWHGASTVVLLGSTLGSTSTGCCWASAAACFWLCACVIVHAENDGMGNRLVQSLF